MPNSTSLTEAALDGDVIYISIFVMLPSQVYIFAYMYEWSMGPFVIAHWTRLSQHRTEKVKCHAIGYFLCLLHISLREGRLKNSVLDEYGGPSRSII